MRGLENPVVLKLSRGGKVLFSASNSGDPHAVTRWIYDVETGAVRDTPDALAVNDTGTTVGIRAAGKDSSGACDDIEVFLEAPDRIRRGLGNPLHGRYGTLACFNRTHDVYLLDEQGRPVVRWGSESNVWDTFRWNGKEWDQLPPVGTFIEGITAVDDRGDLVGGGGSSQGGIAQHGALWRDGTLVEIGTLGGDVSFARGINDAGQVVGSASATPGPSNELPFLWSGGVVRALALPPEHTAGEATAISDDGDIGGFAFAPGGLPASVPMLWVD
ncbi:MAG: hypothetical protein ACJ79P_22045, partial [Myxococcales bacterium]